MGRALSSDKLNLKRALSTEEDDAKILAYTVPRKAGLKRCGKSCRLRWTNHLKPDLKHEMFTPQEEDLIIKLHSAIGSRWSIIVQQLPGRTDNDVKNCWNTKLRKRLIGMGIDPVTHKPFSRILTDYGNIGGFPKASAARMGSLSRDWKNALKLKEKHSQMPGKCSPPAYMLPKMEPSNRSLDLLTELQSINLVKEASKPTTQPDFLNQGISTLSASSTSCSSSTGSTAAQEAISAAAGFSWQDLLLDDAFLPYGPQEPGNLEAHYEVNNNVRVQKSFITGVEEKVSGVHCSSNGFTASSSSSNSSFVEAILDQDSDMLMEFPPNIFEEPFYY